MIRIGRIEYVNKKPIYPSYPGYESIVVMMKSHSPWWRLSPYYLNENGEIMENIWQSSKVYETVPQTTQYYPGNRSRVIWNWKKENHVIDGELTLEYFKWRAALRANKYAVRYPVGFHHRHNCLYAIADDNEENLDDQKSATTSGCLTNSATLNQCLDYVQSRKKIYIPVYTKLAKKERQFNRLRNKLKYKNLLIIEVDGPHQESLQYYKDKYKVDDDFIVGHTMAVTENNINIMVNDDKHPFGHGYCLAISLLDKENDWI